MILKNFSETLRTYNFSKMTIQDLYSRYKSRLQQATFRILNEKFDIEMNEEMLQDYYAGYEMQMKKWPHVPVNIIVDYIKSKKLNSQNGGKRIKKVKSDESYDFSSSETSEPRKEDVNLKIADVGCGTANLSEKIMNVSNFDLHPVNSKITKASSEEIPVSAETFDLVVFSLSLMKKKINKIMKEANRITKTGGHLIIAELTTRIEPKEFIKLLNTYGFELNKIVFESSYFFVIDFKKIENVGEMKDIFLKIPVYKKR